MHASPEQTEHEPAPEQPEEQQSAVAEHVARQRRRAARFAPAPRPRLAVLVLLLLILASVYAYMNSSTIAQAIASVRSSLAGGSPSQQVASAGDALPTQPATTAQSDATVIAPVSLPETATTSGGAPDTSVTPQQSQSRSPAIDHTLIVRASPQLLAVATPASASVDQSMMNAKFLELDNTLAAEIQSVSTANSSEIVGAYQAASFVAHPAAATAVTDEAFTGGTISSLAVSGTGTSTFAGGINLSGGCFSINGNCLSTGGGGSSLTGTAGQVAYFSGTNSVVGTSSLFIAPNGYIGIGTTTPTSEVHLVNNTWNTLTVEDTGTDVSAADLTLIKNGHSMSWSNDGVSLYVWNSDLENSSMGINIATGNVGIGDNSESAAANLAVQNSYGSTNSTVFSIASSTAADGSTANTFLTVSNKGNVGIGIQPDPSHILNA